MTNLPNFSAHLLSKGGFIQEGTISSRNTIMLACTVGDLEYDDPISELVLLSGQDRLSFRAKEEYFVSIDHDENGDAFVLGEHGTVVKFRWAEISSTEELKSSRRLYTNDGAALIGPMRRIRVIGNVAICVGSFGQVYRVDEKKIEPLTFLEIYDEPVTIKEIAGKSITNFVAVTQHGYAAKFDGQKWIDLQLPTNLKLTGVTLLENNDLAIVGSGGNLFIGRDTIWHHFRNDDLPRDYYAVNQLNEHIYLSHIAGIDVFDGVEFHEIGYDNKLQLEFAFMSRAKDSIWAFSGTTIGQIHSKSWITHYNSPR